MAVTNGDKLNLLLLVGGEELQKLLQTLREQHTDYQSHIKKLDQHFKANHNNTLELYKCFNTEWLSDMYFADFEAKCREQAIHFDFPITMDNPIMMTVVKMSSVELHSEIIRKKWRLEIGKRDSYGFQDSQQI